MENASNPDTRLSFHLDENANLSIKKQSPKKKKLKEEYCLGSIEELTKQKALLNELYNVKLFYAKAKAFNLKWKAKKQELLDRQKSEPTLEFGGSMLQSVHVNGSVNPSGSKVQNTNQRQPQNEKLLMMPFQNQISGHPTTSLQVPSTSSNGLGHEAQLAHPGLNINPVEFTQIKSSQSQPLDEATANRELNRALAAEARRRRILILRLKYSQKSSNDYR